MAGIHRPATPRPNLVSRWRTGCSGGGHRQGGWALRTIIASLSTLSGLNLVEASDCNPRDFLIKNFRVQVVDECRITPCPVLAITGIVENTCKSAAGVQLKITAYSADGIVIDTQDFWPASVRNIGAGKTYPFKAGSLFTYSDSMANFDCQTIGVKNW